MPSRAFPVIFIVSLTMGEPLVLLRRLSTAVDNHDEVITFVPATYSRGFAV